MGVAPAHSQKHGLINAHHVLDWYMPEAEVGHASSNATKTSHAPTCNVLNIRQLAICIDRTLLCLAKDAVGKELGKP